MSRQVQNLTIEFIWADPTSSGLCLVFSGDIWLQLERKGNISWVTIPFVALFIVNILLWIDFNFTIKRRARMKEQPANRFSARNPYLESYCLKPYKQATGDFPGDNCGAAERERGHLCLDDSHPLEPSEDHVRELFHWTWARLLPTLALLVTNSVTGAVETWHIWVWLVTLWKMLLGRCLVNILRLKCGKDFETEFWLWWLRFGWAF